MDEEKFIPVTDVEEYLTDSYHIDIYEELTEGSDLKGLFRPLEFFNLLYGELHFFKVNAENYLNIKRHFSKLSLVGEQRFYF